MPSDVVRQLYGHSDATLARARARLARAGQGESPEHIARRDGTSRGAVLRDLRIAREETREAASTAIPAVKLKRRLSDRSMMVRAWTVTRNLNVFRILPAYLTLVWLEVVMEIHLNSDGDLWFGSRYASLAELARAARATETDLEELIARDLLVWLDGGVALPEDLGLRPPECVGGKTIGASGAMPPRRRGSQPDGRQGEILMGLPLGRANPESAKPESDSESGMSETQPGGAEIPPSTLSQTRSPALAGGESTTTTTKDSDSSSSGGGGESVTARDASEAGESESANVESANVESANVESPVPHVALAAELLPLIGRAGTAAPAEPNLVRAWLETKTANQIREAIGTRMERKGAPPAPNLSYFDRRVREWAPRVVSEPSPPPPEPPEDPAATVAWECPNDPDNPRLAAAWTPMRTTLKTEGSAGDWRTLRFMILGGLDGDEIVISLPTTFMRDWVRDKYGPRITLLWKQGYPEARRVDFRVRP